MKEVVETDLFYDGRRWSIAHHLSSGGVAVRNDQYGLRDSSTGGEGRWEGNLRKNPRLHMVGRFNGWTYVEELYDGKQIVMHAVEDCHTALAAAQAVPVPAPAPAPAPPAEAPAPAPPPPPAYAEPAPAPNPAVVAPAAPDFTDSDLPRIHAEYKANQARWSREFADKIFAATMPIASVENEPSDDNYIYVSFMEKANDWWPGVRCSKVVPSELLLQSNKGDSIFVRGVIKDASVGTIDLENCEFSIKDPAAAAPAPQKKEESTGASALDKQNLADQRTPAERARGCAVCVPDEPPTNPIQPFGPATPSPPQPPPEAVPGSIPLAEQALVSAVQAARQAYESATNDLLKGTARVQRGKSICQAIPDRRASHWVGKVSELSSNGEGKGVLAIEIAEGIHAKTWNNALSDVFDDTLIGPSSPVFQQVQSLKVGERVHFSGVFSASDTDCIKESSLTLGGSISEPDFIIKFKEIVPIESMGSTLDKQKLDALNNKNIAQPVPPLPPVPNTPSPSVSDTPSPTDLSRAGVDCKALIAISTPKIGDDGLKHSTVTCLNAGSGVMTMTLRDGTWSLDAQHKWSDTPPARPKARPAPADPTQGGLF